MKEIPITRIPTVNPNPFTIVHTNSVTIASIASIEDLKRLKLEGKTFKKALLIKDKIIVDNTSIIY
jgi:hypothetical protein